MTPAALAALALLESFKTQGRPTSSVAVSSPGAPVGTDPSGAARAVAQKAAAAIRAVASAPPVTVQNVVYVSKNPDDQYHGSIQEAIDACTNPSATNRWLVRVLSPGVYAPAVLKQYVYLTTDGVGVLGGPVTIDGGLGDTLKVPDVDSGVTGFQINTSSPVSSDRAVRLVPGIAQPNSRQTQFASCEITSTGAGYPFGSDPGTINAPSILLNSSLQTTTAAWLAKMEGTGFGMFNGALNQFGTGGGLQAVAGSFNLLIVAVLNGTGDWMMDADGATIVGVDLKAFNLTKAARASNGGAVMIGSMFSIGGLTDLLELDATSIGFLGDLQLLQSGDLYALISSVNPGNVQFFNTLNYAEGTVLGPDTRPASPRGGMTFFASDLVPPRVLTYVPALSAWIDGAGAVI